MIKRTSRRPAQTAAPARQSITAGTSITAAAKKRAQNKPAILANTRMKGLTPAQQQFARQLQINGRKHSKIMGATNTTNIAARPDFLELLPLFVQKLIITDLYGSVAMNSRTQMVPYFKVTTENTKGETEKNTILSSPFVNRQGIDPNYATKYIKNELVASTGTVTSGTLVYVPVLPNSVTVTATVSGVATKYVDNGAGALVNAGGSSVGTIDYATGAITFPSTSLSTNDTVTATYEYDNETVGPDTNGEYGARMGKLILQLDEFNLVAEAFELASYWSVYSAFAAQQEWGSSIADMAKEAAFGELTAEINSAGFKKLKQAATYNTAYNFNVAPVLQGSVVPSDYLNMFKLKLQQAAAGVYQATRLARPNRLSVGTNVATYLGMINSFKAASVEDTVGPYKVGTLDQFEIYCDPNYDPNEWVMSCKSNDIRKNSALFGEYMPFTSTQAVGLANMSVQEGYCSMLAMCVVNPQTVVGGKIVGTF